MSTNKPIIIQSIPNPVLDLSSPIVRHPQPPPSVQPVFSQSPNNNPQVAPQYIESSPKGTQSCACLNSPLNSYKSNQTVSLPQVFDSPCPDSPNIPINCGPHGFLLDGVCFCKPGFKKVNGNCVSSDECTYVLPVYNEPSCEITEIPEVPECPILQYPNQTSCPSIPPTCNSCNGPKKCPPPSFLGCDG